MTDFRTAEKKINARESIDAEESFAVNLFFSGPQYILTEIMPLCHQIK